jgi:hypothetical protein
VTGAILALALALAVGIPLALALPGAASRVPLLLGEGYLLGCGALALLLTALSLGGVEWSLPVLLAGAVVLVIPAAILMRGRGVIAKPAFAWIIGWATAIDALTLVLVAGFLRFVTAAPSIENDYIRIWGLKGRLFWTAHGIDWAFLQAPLNVNAHVDYPILVPLTFSVQALVTGTWPEHWMGVVTAAFGVSALFVVRGMLAEELGVLPSALAALALMPLLFSGWVGLAEGPLIAYSVAGLLWMRYALRQESGAHALRAAIYLGFAASCKLEGMTLILAVAIALVAANRFRFLVRLWPAVAIATPWWILRTVRHLPNDLVAGGALERLIAGLSHPAPILHALAAHPVGQPVFWLGATVACLIGWRKIAGGERFLAVAIVAQLLFLLSAYFVTPHDVVWQVKWSWERIVRQLMPGVALLALFSTWPLLNRRSTV